MIFYKGGHVRGGKGMYVRVVFCTSFDLVHSTLALKLKGYPVGISAGAVLLFSNICQAVECRSRFVFVGLMCVNQIERDRETKRERKRKRKGVSV